MIAELPKFLFVLGLAFGVWWIFLGGRKEIRAARSDRFLSLRARLSSYARMKQPCAQLHHTEVSNLHFVPSGMRLLPEEHDILLGILKKSEAKSAVVLVIAIFALPFLIGVLLPLTEGNVWARAVLFCATGLLASTLYGGFLSAYHLGQYHYRNVISSKHASAIRGRELQTALMEDALRKEAALRISYEIFLLTAFIVLFTFGVLL